jgi:uncharacterized protein YndB with AHSA1/START domain
MCKYLLAHHDDWRPAMEDRIEQEITINADLDRVWDLVTRPGWWVPDTQGGAATDRTPRSVTVRESERYGRFLVRVEKMDPKTYAAFRWASNFPGDEPGDGNSTLVEFFLKPAGGAVSVTLVESGFRALPEDVRESALKDNTSGWQQELAELKANAEKP